MSSADQSTGASGPTKPSITLTSHEKTLFGQLFKQCDPEGLGIVTGEAARPLLEKSNLPATVLGEIWQIADKENNGFLDQVGFSIALRLIGRAQNGQKIYPSTVSVPGPLPVLDGRAARLEPHATGLSDTESIRSVASSAANANNNINNPASTIPPLTEPTRQKFGALFDRAATAGTLDGEKARDIFLKSRLNTETLGQIWTVVDRDSKGYLTKPEFIVAMHLIQAILGGSLKTFPKTIPREFFAASPGSAPPPIHAPIGRQGSVTSPHTATATLNRQLSGSYGRSTPPAIRPNSTGQSEYHISLSEKARFDQIFGSLDKAKTGLLEPDVVVSFLKTSKLPEDILAQIWDLADLHNSGKFGKTEFSVAMYLVQQKLSGRDLPTVLPPSLLASASGGDAGGLGGVIPGSRQASIDTSAPNPVFFTGSNVSSQPQAPVQAPVAAKAPQNSSSLNDLVELNDIFSSPAPQQPVEPAKVSSPGNELKTFFPTSSFGQSIAKEQQQQQQPIKPEAPASRSASQATTIHTPGVVAPASRGSIAGSDLLSGDFGDSDSAKQLSSTSMEVGNLTNQHRSLQTQHASVADKRRETEAELGRVLESKKDLESKIALLRTSYESEVKKHQQHQDLLKTSKAETSKLQREYGVIAASFQALREEFDTLTQSLTKDREENLAIKEQIRVVTEQNAALQQSLEAAQKDAKQQRNVLAVSKSQLQAAEEEKQKIEAKIAQAKEEAATLAKQIEETDNKTSSINTANVEANEVLSNVLASNTSTTANTTANMPASASSREIHAPSVESERNKYGEFGYGPSYGPPSTEATGRSTDARTGDFYDNTFASQYPAATANTRTSTHVTEEGTQSSPPSSDFAFNQRETSTFPSFILPMDRPPSVTSSVQNNAPLSVREDLDTSRPESPVYTSEPVSGLVPPESLDLPPENENNRSTYPDHVLTGEEFRANSSSSLPLGNTQASFGTEAPNSFHETSDSYEFVNAEDSDKGSLEAAMGQPTTTATATSAAATTTVGPMEDVKEVVEDATAAAAAPKPAGSSGSITTETTHEHSIASAFMSSVPGSFPGIPAPEDVQEQAQEPVVEQDVSKNLPSGNPPAYDEPEGSTSIAQASEGPDSSGNGDASSIGDVARPTAESVEASSQRDIVQEAEDQFPEMAVPKTVTKDEDSDSSGDEEGPEEVFPTYRQKHTEDHQSPDNSDANSVSSYESARSVEGEPAVGTVAESVPASVPISAPASARVLAPAPVPIPVQADNDDIFEPSRSSTHATLGSDAKTSQTQPPANFDDFFNEAFQDLSEAQVVTQDETPDTFADTFDDFENNFNIKGDSFDVPSTKSVTSGQGSSSGTATGTTAKAPNTNDEWEQLFAGFGNEGVNNNADFEDAFATESHAPVAPAPVQSPNSQAVTELVNMGFKHSDAVEALQKHGYNIAEASNYLLDQV